MSKEKAKKKKAVLKGMVARVNTVILWMTHDKTVEVDAEKTAQAAEKKTLSFVEQVRKQNADLVPMGREKVSEVWDTHYAPKVEEHLKKKYGSKKTASGAFLHTQIRANRKRLFLLALFDPKKAKSNGALPFAKWAKEGLETKGKAHFIHAEEVITIMLDHLSDTTNGGYEVFKAKATKRNMLCAYVKEHLKPRDQVTA